MSVEAVTWNDTILSQFCLWQHSLQSSAEAATNGGHAEGRTVFLGLPSPCLKPAVPSAASHTACVIKWRFDCLCYNAESYKCQKWLAPHCKTGQLRPSPDSQSTSSGAAAEVACAHVLPPTSNGFYRAAFHFK